MAAFHIFALLTWLASKRTRVHVMQCCLQGVVIGFALLLALVLFLSKALTELLGDQGGLALAAIAGIADVDAITLSMTEVTGQAIAPGIAALSILVAVVTNSLSKSVLAMIAGGLRFGLAYLAVSLAAILAGGLIALTAPWL